MPEQRVLIAGIGNVLMGDDGVGPLIVAHLRARYEFADGVRVEDLGTPGLDLIFHFAGKSAVILVDAMEDDALAPGATRIFTKAEILAAPVPVRLDPHSPSLREALLLTPLEGAAPDSVVLIGVAARSFAMGQRVSTEVMAALERIIETVTGEIARAGVEFRARARAEAPDLWWVR